MSTDSEGSWDLGKNHVGLYHVDAVFCDMIQRLEELCSRAWSWLRVPAGAHVYIPACEAWFQGQ